MSSEKNHKREHLKRDNPIPGQKFALISMVEPTNSKLVMNRESFFASHFIKWFLEERQTLDQYIDEAEQKQIDLELDDITKQKLDLSYENIQKLYYDYVGIHGKELDQQFNALHNEHDELVVTGLKIRGVYPAMDDLQENVNNFHQHEPFVDIYCAPVGQWIPYCPAMNSSLTEQYQHDKLNQIMEQQRQNQLQKNNIFDDRLHET